jgi:hypothetical protein
MSGGSYCYFYQDIEAFKHKLLDTVETMVERRPQSVARAALYHEVIDIAKRLQRITEPCHAVEWADSCDTSNEDADKIIMNWLSTPKE